MKADEKIVKSIDLAIADYIQKNSMTREAMATEMNMSTNTLRWKREGKYDWTWSEILKLSEIIGCTVEGLASYKPKQTTA